MPPLVKLINRLDKNNIKYELKEHRKVYTTYDSAQTQKIDVKSVGKTLLLKADNKFLFAVIPGNKKMDIVKLKKTLNKYYDGIQEKKIKKIKIASEVQIKNNITKKVGALPPFGSLYKIPTFIDKSLFRLKKININAGSFTDSIEITPAQFKKFEEPIEGIFSKK